MGTLNSKVDTNAVHQEVSSVPVMMYTKHGCSFCTRARELLNNEKIEYKECNTDELKKTNPQQYQPLINGLVYMTRQTSLPQIFICGKFIGGFTDLEKLRNSRQLLDAVAECAVEHHDE
ncbi:glutaredoxin [Dictyocaulus viviparus]|uniref:Glutaredoxin n=1 Tax=Dictyocaulus viviparus TaxID=29172 RepID=A0A0D8Y4C8_DICVI|nr:glutaredoxin [Dictyocaulus viviparus]